MDMVRVIEVQPLEGYCLRVRFNDGSEGTVDISSVIPFQNDYARLRDPDFFCQVSVEKDFGAIVWPGDLDIDPLTLYMEATGREVRLDDGVIMRPSARELA